jgi:hypothetical protein
MGFKGTKFMSDTASDTERKLKKSRAIITSACRMLDLAKHGHTFLFSHDFNGSGADFYVLLHDATQLFCQAVSEQFGETPNCRWSPVLPELLLSHPDRCEETLERLLQREFRDVSYFQFVEA